MCIQLQYENDNFTVIIAQVYRSSSIMCASVFVAGVIVSFIDIFN